MPAKMQMEGLKEFRVELKKLPAELVADSAAVVFAHAEDAQRQIAAGYPQGPTGNLKAGVTVERQQGNRRVFARVRSRAAHSHIFEKGTKVRTTREGWNRGRMPPAPESARMIPKVIRLRRRMELVLMGLLERYGFLVREAA